MRFAMIGTRGVPACYGGFETAVEEVGSRLVERGHEVTVFCRNSPQTEGVGSTYLGMRRVVLPALRKRSLETLSHTALSAVHPSLRDIDSAIVFNAANSPFLPILRAQGIPVATHVDGLEWKREKWGSGGQTYYRWAESLAVRWSDDLIADAQGIADYYDQEFHAETRLIAYGAPILGDRRSERVAELDLEPNKYHLVVARFERENHVLEIVEGYVRSNSRVPLVVVGSAPYADEYTKAIEEAADGRVRLLGGVWDQDLLDALYANALTYLHGHSVGGTNPSLLRAGGAGASVIAFDVSFNREVLQGYGRYFSNPEQLARRIEQAEADPTDTRRRGLELQEAIARYNWDDVADRYERLLTDLADMKHLPRPPRPSGRRHHKGTLPERVPVDVVAKAARTSIGGQLRPGWSR